ncbi:MAG: hypothetical protein ACR2FS_07090 [Phormidesmis sp.]
MSEVEGKAREGKLLIPSAIAKFRRNDPPEINYQTGVHDVESAIASPINISAAVAIANS